MKAEGGKEEGASALHPSSFRLCQYKSGRPMRKEAAALGFISKMKYNTRSQPDCAFSLGGQPPCSGGHNTGRRRF